MIDVIWKFPFDIEDEFSMAIPEGARFLKVDVQDQSPVMWFQIHTFPDAVLYEQRKFKIITTGRTFESGRLDYRDTFMLLHGNFVGHLYEVVQ